MTIQRTMGTLWQLVHNITLTEKVATDNTQMCTNTTGYQNIELRTLISRRYKNSGRQTTTAATRSGQTITAVTHLGQATTAATRLGQPTTAVTRSGQPTTAVTHLGQTTTAVTRSTIRLMCRLWVWVVPLGVGDRRSQETVWETKEKALWRKVLESRKIVSSSQQKNKRIPCKRHNPTRHMPNRTIPNIQVRLRVCCLYSAMI